MKLTKARTDYFGPSLSSEFGSILMSGFVIAIVALSSASIFLAHAVEAYLTQ